MRKLRAKSANEQKEIMNPTRANLGQDQDRNLRVITTITQDQDPQKISNGFFFPCRFFKNIFLDFFFFSLIPKASF